MKLIRSSGGPNCRMNAAAVRVWVVGFSHHAQPFNLRYSHLTIGRAASQFLFSGQNIQLAHIATRRLSTSSHFKTGVSTLSLARSEQSRSECCREFITISAGKSPFSPTILASQYAAFGFVREYWFFRFSCCVTELWQGPDPPSGTILYLH